MAVPIEIRQIPRPVNTIVEDSGRNGPKRYAVRQRSSTKYVSGGNPQPHNGKVIGHIIDSKFVPIEDTPGKLVPDMLSYGASALVKSLSKDLLDDLLTVYDPSDSFAIMAAATLRVIKPSITVSRMSTHYNRCFVCIDYPGVAITKNSLGKLFQRIGMDGNKRKQFYQRRMIATSDSHHVAIDGMLKQDTSCVNDLSAFSYQARKKGYNEVSVLYAYDIERMEPICAEVFPGNSIDASSYPAFIRDNNIQRGIIVADKGFPPSTIQSELSERPDLHFLTPIKRNDSRIANNEMLAFDGVLDGINAHVVYRKRQITPGRFLYSFKDVQKAANEESAYLACAKKKNNFSPEKYASKQNLFGVIVLESDLDLPPKTVYSCYDDRWLIELVFRHYKNDECLDHTSSQGDFTVIGSEFVNFISTIITCRIIRKAERAGLLKEMSYGDLMDDLSSAWRKTDAPVSVLPASDDSYWVHTLKSVFKELEVLGLSKPVPKSEPRKRGRKPKTTSQPNTN